MSQGRKMRFHGPSKLVEIVVHEERRNGSEYRSITQRREILWPSDDHYFLVYVSGKFHLMRLICQRKHAITRTMTGYVKLHFTFAYESVKSNFTDTYIKNVFIADTYSYLANFCYSRAPADKMILFWFL